MSDVSAIEQILKTIEQSAQTQIDTLISSARQRQQEAMARAGKRLRDELGHKEKIRLDQIRTAAGKEICAAQSNARARLFHHRETLRRQVMEQAEKEIVAFTKTPAYKEFLIGSAQKIHLAMQGNCAVLNMRECDRGFAAQVSAHLGRSITLHIDPTIRLGGISVISADNSLLIDDTLDARMNAQNQWFTEHSGLTVE